MVEHIYVSASIYFSTVNRNLILFHLPSLELSHMRRDYQDINDSNSALLTDLYWCYLCAESMTFLNFNSEAVFNNKGFKVTLTFLVILSDHSSQYFFWDLLAFWKHKQIQNMMIHTTRNPQVFCGNLMDPTRSNKQTCLSCAYHKI